MCRGGGVYAHLSTTLSTSYPQHKVDLRQEDPENTIVRMLSLLRVLKYRPTKSPA